jgi:hypothetical protein
VRGRGRAAETAWRVAWLADYFPQSAGLKARRTVRHQQRGVPMQFSIVMLCAFQKTKYVKPVTEEFSVSLSAVHCVDNLFKSK